MNLSTGAAFAIAALEQQGFEAYAVGGCVRDQLLGLAPQDWDICTSALPQQVQLCFANHPVIETGLQHGTLTVWLAGEPVEITTYREDGIYTDNRHPDAVRFVRSLQQDLARRDFTMNAIAYHPERGLVDPFGGQADLAQGVLRSVGDPDERFREDALRILRALRFAARFSLAPVPALHQSILRSQKQLANCAPERINKELCGLLVGDGVRAVLRLYVEVLGVVIPELLALVGFAQHHPRHQYDVWHHTVESVHAAPPNLILRLTMLLHDCAKPACHTVGPDGIDHFCGHPARGAELAQARLSQLRFDRRTIETVCTLITWHDAHIPPQQVARWMGRLGEECFSQLLLVQRADVFAQAPAHRQQALQQLDVLAQTRDVLLKERHPFQLRDLAINGHDLLALGVESGPAVGTLLRALLDQVMDGKLPNDHEILCNAVRRSLPGS